MTTEKNGSQKPTTTPLSKTTASLADPKEQPTSTPLSEGKQTGLERPSNPITAPPTKMEIATEIFIKMRNSPGVTRKEIIDQFVTDAKLSKAGASTYYQLIKAKTK